MPDRCPVTNKECPGRHTLVVLTTAGSAAVCNHTCAVVVASGGMTGRPTDPACGGCGTPFAAVADGGKLGCEKCYPTLTVLMPTILPALHAGATAHAGKRPRAAGLRRDMAAAVAAERYEEAAALRDELRRIGS